MISRKLILALSSVAVACGAVACGEGGSGSTVEGSTGAGTGASSSGAVTLPVTTAEPPSGSTAADTSSTTPSGSTGASETLTSGEEGSSSTGTEDTETACDLYDAYVETLVAATDAAEREAVTDTFVAEARYSDTGFPLRCPGRVIFFARSATPTSVAGEFNDWDPSADPMVSLVEGFEVLVLDRALGDEGAYKLVTGGDSFAADPLARRFGWDDFGEFSLVAPQADAGHHERWPAFSEGVGELEPRTVTVFVPRQVNAEPDVPVGVLYLHDGQNVFSPDALFGGWRASQTLAELLDADAVAPMLMVAIDNTSARFDEYTHVADDIGGGPIGGRAGAYGDFLVNGIKPFIDERYSTRSSADSTAVLGSSLGGLVSLVLGHAHPDVFGYAGSMSGTLGWGTFGGDGETIGERYAAAPPTGLSLYVDSGGDGPCPDDGSDNYCENVAFVDVVRAAGWTDEADLFYRWAPGASHNEAAWAQRLGTALTDWFPSQQR